MKNLLYEGITPKENMLKGKTLKMPPNRASKRENGRKHRLYFRIYQDDIDNGIIAKVGVTAWAVYCVIKRHENWHNHTCCPTFERIKKLTGIVDHRTIRGAIERLKDNGLLTYEFKKCVYKDTGREYGRPRYFYSLKKESAFYDEAARG